MFFLSPVFEVFWEKLRFKMIYLSARRFFVVTSIFGVIIVSAVVILIFFRSHWLILSALAFLSLSVWSVFAVYTKLHSIFWARREIKSVEREAVRQRRMVRRKK